MLECCGGALIVVNKAMQLGPKARGNKACVQHLKFSENAGESQCDSASVQQNAFVLVDSMSSI